jgi:hypothetical protein
MASEVRDLSSLLSVLQRKIDSDSVNGGIDHRSLSVRETLELVGRRAYGPLLLIVGLISISPLTLLPGSTWAVATLTLLISIQLMFHKRTPWMPQAALEMRLSEVQLERFIRAARPTADAVDKVIRPRLQFLADPPWVVGVALLCVLSALTTFPLGLVPMAPLAPGLAITFFGLGLTARDGLLLAVGTGFMGSAFWFLIARVF